MQEKIVSNINVFYASDRTKRRKIAAEVSRLIVEAQDAENLLYNCVVASIEGVHFSNVDGSCGEQSNMSVVHSNAAEFSGGMSNVEMPLSSHTGHTNICALAVAVPGTGMVESDCSHVVSLERDCDFLTTALCKNSEDEPR